MGSLSFKFWCVICLLCCGALLNACTPNGIYHTVQPGQTLYRIAQTYDVDERDLAQVNRINDPTKLKAGQRLYIPGASQTRRVPSTTSSQPSSQQTASARKTMADKPTTTASPKATTSKTTQAITKTPAKKTTTASVKPIKGIFVWPVKGKVLRDFNNSSTGGQKGIEIEAGLGGSVVAAAPGKVIYSGNAIRGYGNLIILEHSDNYFTVYGFNKQNLVTMNDYVGQGDKIALAGSPPNGKSPRLHFEIRHGKTPVNPIFYLP